MHILPHVQSDFSINVRKVNKKSSNVLDMPLESMFYNFALRFAFYKQKCPLDFFCCCILNVKFVYM